MNWEAVSFDWNQIRAFLATVEEGSLSAAARALGLTQPTLSRQVSSLEEDLGVVLFERSRRSMLLTQSGLELLDHVRAMGDAAMRISITASGQSQDIEGHVSITATDTLTTYVLPKVLAQLRQAAPAIAVELISTNEIRDLTRREADIAIRHVRPEQPDLIAKLVCNSSAHFYASKSYLANQGHPVAAEDLSKAEFIGLEQVERILPVLNALGLQLTAQNFKITTTSGATLMELVKQGLGISMFPRHVADLDADLQCVLPEYDIPVPIWLVTHRELRTSRRIRLVYDFLADALAKM